MSQLECLLPFQGGSETAGWHRIGEVERWVASLSGQCQSQDARLGDLTASLRKLQLRVDQMDGGREALSSLVRQAVSQRLTEMSADGLSGPQVPRQALGGLRASGGRRRGGSAGRGGARRGRRCSLRTGRTRCVTFLGSRPRRSGPRGLASSV